MADMAQKEMDPSQAPELSLGQLAMRNPQALQQISAQRTIVFDKFSAAGYKPKDMKDIPGWDNLSHEQRQSIIDQFGQQLIEIRSGVFLFYSSITKDQFFEVGGINAKFDELLQSGEALKSLLGNNSKLIALEEYSFFLGLPPAREFGKVMPNAKEVNKFFATFFTLKAPAGVRMALGLFLRMLTGLLKYKEISAQEFDENIVRIVENLSA